MKRLSQMTDAEVASYTAELTAAVSLMMPRETHFVLILSDPGGNTLYLTNGDSGQIVSELRRGVWRFEEQERIKEDQPACR
jgi:hypothetical protein